MSDDELSEFRAELEKMPLGELVDQLVCRRIEEAVGEPDARMQREIAAVKRELDRRQTGRSVPEKKGKRGIRSVGGLL